MAELTFKSPGVGTREIDLSSPTQTVPVGIPAGVIGTAQRGPAFVPVTVASYSGFVAKFGPSDGEKFGPLALNEWLKNAQAGTYLRVLGAGDAKKRVADATDDTAAGGVLRAGFVVGSQQVQANGLVGHNLFSNPNDQGGAAATLTAANGMTLTSDDPAFTMGGEVGNTIADGSIIFQITIVIPHEVTSGFDDETYLINLIGKEDGEPAVPGANTIAVAINNGHAADTPSLSGAGIRNRIVLAINGDADSDPKIVYGSGTDATNGIPGLTAATSGDGLNLSLVEHSAKGNQATVKIQRDPGTAANLVPTKTTPQLFSAKMADNTAVNLSGGVTANPGLLGRTYMLGCFMSASAGSTVFQEAGMKPGADSSGMYQGATNGVGTPLFQAGADAQKIASGSIPILRGVLMAASGVMLSLSSSAALNNRVQENERAKGSFGPYADDQDAGLPFGSVDLSGGSQDFVMLLNGQPGGGAHPNILSASFDPNSPNYFPNIFNRDPLKYEEAGHLLHTYHSVYPSYATVTGSGLTGVRQRESTGPGTFEVAAFLVTSSLDRNVGSATIPNFEGFRDRFRHAASPFFVSQNFGGKPKDLFRLHALDAGAIGNKYKISVENILKSNNDDFPYGKFDLLIRDVRDSDREQLVLEAFRGLSLNPSDDRYIARVIGDINLFFDFDKDSISQKLMVEGSYANSSRYVRVEMNQEVDDGLAPAEALPIGFRGPHHLVTSGSSIAAPATLLPVSANASSVMSFTTSEPVIGNTDAAGNPGNGSDIIRRIVQPPVPMRSNLAVGQSPRQKVDSDLYWGIQFEVKDSLTLPNKNNKFDEGILEFMKYKPTYATTQQSVWVGNNAGAADVQGTVLDSDKFNNNLFTLERVLIKTQSNDTPDPKEWVNAIYRRDGVTPNSGYAGYRFLNVKKDFGSLTAKRFLKFSAFMQGGFDGLNVFDKQKFDMSNTAVMREMNDVTNQGGKQGATVATFRKAVDVMGEKSDVDIQLLAIPGIRHGSVTDYTMDAIEERFDAVYIMDIEERDKLNNVVTSSITQKTSVTYTAQSFKSRNLDNSFAAAYFPDVIVRDPATQTNVQCPPSVGVLGAFSKNDAIAHPWFAPAGFTRGAMDSVIEAQVKLSRDNLDTLYDVDINPITAFPQTPGVVVFGQKTLQAAQSALDRVNVRRLLIDVRRKVKGVANSILFEPNRAETLARFSTAVEPILAQIQAQQGIDRFKVVIDTSTTTKIDVENNTIRGKIFLQPTRSVEFISLDFVVTNAGAEI